MTDYYVCHDKAKGKIWRVKSMPVPEIFWLDDTSIPLTREWQEFIFTMNQPGMTKKRWKTFIGKRTAVANTAGFGDDDDPRADFINGENLGSPLPRIGKCYTFGGAKLRGTVKNGYLIVETLDGSKPPPAWKDIKDKYWLYSTALIVQKDGATFNFPYRGGLPVLFPLVAIGEVKVKINLNVKDKPIPLIKRI